MWFYVHCAITPVGNIFVLQQSLLSNRPLLSDYLPIPQRLLWLVNTGLTVCNCSTSVTDLFSWILNIKTGGTHRFSIEQDLWLWVTVGRTVTKKSDTNPAIEVRGQVLVALYFWRKARRNSETSTTGESSADVDIQYCAKVMQTYVNEIHDFSWLFDKKYRILDGSEFTTKSHNNSQSLLFTTTRIFNDNSFGTKRDFKFSSEKSLCSINDFEHMSKISLFISSAQTFPSISWTAICQVRSCHDDSFVLSSH